MKKTYLLFFGLLIFFGQLTIAAPTGTTLSPERIEINHHTGKKKIKKERLSLQERFQRWKIKTTVKTLQKQPLQKGKQAKTDRPDKHGRKSLLFALIGILGLLFSPILITIGALAASGGILAFGIIFAGISATFCVLSFFKGIKGLKYDDNPNKAIAGIILGSIFTIGLLLLLIFAGQIWG